MIPPRLLQDQDWETLAREAAFQPAVMAALCPISLRQMQRFFVNRFDKTPGEWIRELRCRLARQLVAEGWSNRAVAVELGFSNESHVCHVFKRVFGVSPQKFALASGRTPSAAAAPSRIPIANHHSPVTNLRSSITRLSRQLAAPQRSDGASRTTRHASGITPHRSLSCRS